MVTCPQGHLADLFSGKMPVEEQQSLFWERRDGE